MKILVTGSTGFLGSAICIKLAEAGIKVHAFGRTVEDNVTLRHKNIALFKGDILDAAALGAAAEGCTGAFHLAAFVKVRAKDSSVYFDVNVKGTECLMTACLEAGVKRVVFTSTCGTFPPSGNGTKTIENCVRSAPFFNDYAESKFIAEQVAMGCINKGIEVVVVYPTRVYGPGPVKESNSLSKIIKLYMQGKWRIIPGKGTALGNYAYINDVVKGHINAMKYGKSGESYLLGGENLSLLNVIEAIKMETKSDRRLISISGNILLPLIVFQEMLFKISRKPPFITRSWFKRLEFSSAFSTEKAERELDYKVTPFTTGLKNTVQYLKEMKEIS